MRCSGHAQSAWRSLLAQPDARVVLPYVGNRVLHDADRTYWIAGEAPDEHGWYAFTDRGSQQVRLIGSADRPDVWFDPLPVVRGFLVGDRLFSDGADVDCVQSAPRVHLIDPGLDLLCRVEVVRDRADRLIFRAMLLPVGPEADVIRAYEDRVASLDGIKAVTPSMAAAFVWLVDQRARQEEYVRHLAAERAREEQERHRRAQMQEALRTVGNPVGRRQVAQVDFETAARAALRYADAELLSVRDGNDGTKIVRYRYRGRRFECVSDPQLRILDAGFCVTDENTGRRDDALLTLETIALRLGTIQDEGRLVVFRHG